MGQPWEKYQGSSGPWDKYAAKPVDASAVNTPDTPEESNLFGDSDRIKSSFGDTKGVGKFLLSKGFVDFAKNKNGDLVAKDSKGVWHKDADKFFSGHPINWAESGAGKALPLLGGMAGGLAGIESGPGAIATAAAGGAAGELGRSSIGRGMGVYDGDLADQGIDAAKEAAIMGTGEGLGRYVLPAVGKSLANSGVKDIANTGMNATGRGLAKVGELFTGVPEQEIKTYAQHGPEIDAAYKAADGNTQDMANNTRQMINDKVSAYKKGVNADITQALAEAPEEKSIDVHPVLKRLQAARDKMDKNPNMNKEALKDLDDLLMRVKDPMEITPNHAQGYVTGDRQVPVMSNDGPVMKNGKQLFNEVPNEKAVTITKNAAGGPQKKYILHDPSDHEAHLPMAPGEVMSDIPGQSGQRSVPVLDTTIARHGEGAVPSTAALDLLGQKGMSREGIAKMVPEISGDPLFPGGALEKSDAGVLFNENGKVAHITDPGYSSADSLRSFPIGKQALMDGSESLGRSEYHANLNGLNDIKRFLQDQGSPAYGGSPLGFQVGKAGANEAKNAGGVARDLMNQSADTLPGAEAIKGANAKLSRLHDIEDVMNKNLLEDGKTASPLFAAGSGNNQQSSNVLRDLGGEIGSDVLSDVHKLAAARTFGNPHLMPIDTNGKSRARMALAGSIGAGIGYLGGAGLPGATIGGGIASALTSPATVKLAINGGRAVGNAVSSPLVKAIATNPQLLQSIANPALRGALSSAVSSLGGDDNSRPNDETHYDPSNEKAQPIKNAQQKLLEEN
jgi:hypothetical protein